MNCALSQPYLQPQRSERRKTSFHWTLPDQMDMATPTSVKNASHGVLTFLVLTMSFDELPSADLRSSSTTMSDPAETIAMAGVSDSGSA